jgi:hypothetical protein
MRFDATLAIVNASQTYDNLLPGWGTGAASGLGGGFNAHMTAYYKITDELVAQFGIKETIIMTSKNLDSNLFDTLGAYVSLGYIHRF